MNEGVNISTNVFMENSFHQLLLLQCSLHITLILERNLLERVNIIVLLIEYSVNNPEPSLCQFSLNFIIPEC